MAKSLALLGCHLHAACGRCIQLSYWRMDGYIIKEKGSGVKGGVGRKKRQKAPLQNGVFPL